MSKINIDCQGVVLITGAGTGIGQAIALQMAQTSVTDVILVGRRGPKLQETADSIGEFATAHCIKADVTKAEDRAEIVRYVKELKKGLNTLINNAGAFDYCSLLDTSDESIDTMIDVNLKAPLALTRDLMPYLIKAHGNVINISSTLAIKPIANTTGYNSAKAGLIQATKTLALEFGPSKVRVNAILPAVVETPMYKERFATPAEYEKAIEEMSAQHPIGRVGQPDDIANGALFLASESSSWVTGLIMAIDGGMLVT